MGSIEQMSLLETLATALLTWLGLQEGTGQRGPWVSRDTH